jgi:uncharacterized protein
MFERHIYARLLESLNAFRVVYIPGARQAGKSTLVRQIAKQRGLHYVTLDDSGARLAAETDPEGFVAEFLEGGLALDEIQYVPNLVFAIKQASDLLPPNEKGKFLLTGSSDLFAGKQVSDRLPGHMETLTLYPLSQSELSVRSRNTLDQIVEGEFASVSGPTTRGALCQAILAGGYPETQSMSSRARISWYRSYIDARILKDFEQVYSGRGDFVVVARALLDLLAGRCGNLLNFHNLANELRIGDEKTKKMTAAFEQMFIVHRVNGYLKNRSKRLAVTSPKSHFVDTGLACYLLGLRTREQLVTSSHFGGLLENFVLMDLCKNAVFSEHEVDITHFRDNYQREVDIVLEEPGGSIIGIEVKAAQSITKSDFKGLLALANYAGSRFSAGILLYSGDKVLPIKFGDFTFTAVPFASLYPQLLFPTPQIS